MRTARARGASGWRRRSRRAKPNSPPSVKAGGGVDIDRRRINATRERVRSRFIFCKDRFRVLGAETIDVSDRLFKAFNTLDADLVVKVFGSPVLFGRCLDGDIELGCHFAYHLIAMDAHPLLQADATARASTHARCCDRGAPTHRHCTRPRAGSSHSARSDTPWQDRQIRGCRYGNFRARFDDRNERMLHTVPNEPCPTARNEHIDQVAQ